MENSFSSFLPNSCLKNLTVNDYFLLDAIEKRNLYIFGEIDEIVSEDIVTYIRQFNEMDQNIPEKDRKPIKIYIASAGGSVFDGFTIINAIEQSKTPVWTINIGYCFSMAFHILISGHQRFAYKNSIFLHHDGSDFMVGSALKNQDYAEFSQLYRERIIRQNVLDHTKITEDELKEKERCEWYMFADEAMRKGVIDKYMEESKTIF